jgi:hypothetical protein
MEFNHVSLATTARMLWNHRDTGATALMPNAPEGGYVVGGVVTPRVLHASLGIRLQEVHQAVSAIFSDAFANGVVTATQAVGIWADGDHVYLDASSIVADRDDALALARQRGELAVWDRENGVEIRTGVRED